MECGNLACDTTLTRTGLQGGNTAIISFSVWEHRTNNNSLTGRVFNQSFTFTAAAPTAHFSIDRLSPKTTYYINTIRNIFSFTTEEFAQSGNYRLQAAQTGSKITTTFTTPTSETRPLYLNFESAPGISALRSAVPATVSKVVTGAITLYTYIIENAATALKPGIYNLYLEAGTEPLITKVVGPQQVSIATTTIAAQKLTYTAKGDSIVVTGKLDTTVHPDFKKFNITFDWGKNRDFSDNSGPVTPTFADDGTYSLTLKTNPSTVYFIQQTITGTAGQQLQTTDIVNSTDGIVPLSGQPAQDYKNARTYRLLSPFPKLFQVYDPDYCALQKQLGNAIPVGTICDINEFLNYLLKLLIGFAGIALVLRIMFEGYKILTSDVPYLKVNAKSDIAEAALGLGLVLTAWIILNTINPALVTNTITLNDVAAGVEIVNLPDAGDSTVDPDFNRGKGTYSTDATISPGITTAVDKLKNGWSIDYFKVYTNDRMLIALRNGAQTDTSTVISVSHGLNGFAPTNTAQTGDKKTPIGNWKILDIRKPAADHQAVFNGNGANMGAVFYLLSPMIDGERGIGMHGNKNGTLGSTSGCIRVKNADLLALFPYIQKGTNFYITN